MKLETLNIWGGRKFDGLLEHIEQQKNAVDIFCFQEVYHTSTTRTHTRIGEEANKDTNGIIPRANMFAEFSKTLPDHQGYYFSAQDNADYVGFVDFDLSFGLAMFVRDDLAIQACGDIFVHNERNTLQGIDHATEGRNLAYMQFQKGGALVTVGNLHGLWNGQGKTDTEERISQSRKVKKFLDSQEGAKILCGDFNLNPDTESLRILENGMRNLVKEYGITSTRSNLYEKPGKFADYILVSPEITVVDFKVLQDVVSDHLPLQLEFE